MALQKSVLACKSSEGNIAEYLCVTPTTHCMHHHAQHKHSQVDSWCLSQAGREAPGHVAEVPVPC